MTFNGQRTLRVGREISECHRNGQNNKVTTQFVTSVRPGEYQLNLTFIPSICISFTRSSNRRFSIRPSSDENCDDIGWITMITKNGDCGWDDLRPPPNFIYTRTPSSAKWPASINSKLVIKTFRVKYSSRGLAFRRTEVKHTHQVLTQDSAVAEPSIPELRPGSDSRVARSF